MIKYFIFFLYCVRCPINNINVVTYNKAYYIP
jgi:hypothetical protein